MLSNQSYIIQDVFSFLYLKKNSFWGKVIFAFFLFVFSHVSFGQSTYTYTYIHNCGDGLLSAQKILDYGVNTLGLMTPGHASTGTWDTALPGGLAFVNPGVTNENAVFTNFVVGNSYTLLWYKNNNFDYYITVEIGTVDQPIATFDAINPASCSASYSACLDISISGGASPYDYDISNGSSVITSGTNVGTGNSFSITTCIGGQTTDMTFYLLNVSDANGCIPSGLPMDASFTLTSPPSVVSVTGTNDCSSATITIPSPESGYTYYLAESGTKVAGSEISSAPYSWTVNTVGSYTVYAENPCGSDLLMSGGPFVITGPLEAYGVTLLGSGPYCAGNSYTVQVANSQANVTYTLYDKYGNKIGASVTSTSSGVSLNLGPNTLPYAGDYTVVASVGTCTLSMSNVVTIGEEPLVHSIVSKTVCEGTTLTVHMQTSTNNIVYTLMYQDLLGNTSAVETITAAGAGFDFSPVTAIGSYYVVASDVFGCTSTMNGTAYVNKKPTAFSLNYTGTLCPSGIVSIGTSSNPVESTVTYELLKDGVSTGITRPGTSAVNGVLSFGEQTTEGLYTVRAINGTCTTMMTGSLQVYEEPDVLTLTTNKTKYCATESLSGVNISISGIEASSGYLLQIQNGASWDDVGSDRYGAEGGTITWTNLTEGVYRVLASNNGGCSVEMDNRITVTIVTEPNATVSVIGSNRRCEDETTTFTLSIALTGNPPYNFDIIDDKGNTVTTVTGISSSTYTYVVDPDAATTVYSIANLTDVASCTAVDPTSTATVYVDPIPTISFTPTDPEVCIGTSTTISADGAGVGGTYVWSAGLGTTQSITVTPNVTTSYSVTATSTYGCSASKDITVVVNNLPVVDFTTPGSDYEYCENDGTVSLTGTPAGGTFSGNGVVSGGSIFDPNPATSNASITTASNYGANSITYTYTDANSCTNTITKEISVNSIPTVLITNLNDTYCYDAGTVTFYGFPNGSAAGSVATFTIVGYDAQKGTWWNQASTDATATINVTQAVNTIGSKTIRVRYTYTDTESCTASIEQNVTLLPDYSQELSFTGLPVNVCETEAPVTLTPYLAGVQLTPADGTISFTGPSGSLTDNGDGTFEFDPGVAGAGDHTITLSYTDLNGCEGSVSETIQVGIPLNLVNFPEEYCSSNGSSYRLIGQVDGAAPPAPDLTVFSVLDPNGNIIISNAPNDSYDFIPSTLFGNYGGGVYQVIYYYEDANGCVNTLTTEVSVIEEISSVFTIDGLPFATAQSNYCIGDSPAVLMGSSDLTTKALGTVSSVFTGNGVSGNGITGGYFNPGDASVNYTGANTITHTVIHTVNGLSCPSPVSTFDVYVSQVLVGINNLSPTKTYCTNDGTSVINVNGIDAATGTAQFYSTKNGSASAFITDNGDNTAILNPAVGPGTYEITLVYTRTSDGCSTTVVETVEVFADTPVNFSGVSDGQKICQESSSITLRGDMPSGGVGNFTITPVVSGGIENSGTDDLGNVIADDDGVANLVPTALAIGPYTITYEYTNAAGCSVTQEKTIEIVSSPSVIYDVVAADKNNNDSGAYCDDDAAPDRGIKIGLSGSNSGVTYELLLGGVSLSPAVTFTGNGSGFYFQDASNNDIRFTQEGMYTIRAVQNSCDAMMNGSVLVEQYELVLEQESKTNVSCNSLSNGVVVLKTTGGSGSYEYSDDGGSSWQASSTFSGLSVGDHTFSVKDLSSAACEAIDVLTITISQPSAISIVEDVSLNVKVGCVPCVAGLDCEGSATISVSGGTPDYTKYTNGYDISWSTGGSDFTETLMPVGTHSVRVFDGNDCKQSINIDITANDPLILAEDVNPVLHVDNICNSGTSGSFVVTATGGSGTYQFALTDPALTTPTWRESNYGSTGDQYQYNGLAAGSYTIWVRDRNSLYSRCYAQVDVPVVIAEPDPLTVVEKYKEEISCNAANDGLYSVLVSGGSGSYEYTFTNPDLGSAAWSLNGTDSVRVDNVTAGTYTVWIRDMVNPSCDPVSLSITLADITPLSYILMEHTNVSCNPGSDGRLQVLGQGGSGNYVYQWENSSGVVISSTEYAENLVAGDYTLSITDPEGDPSYCSPLVETFTITQPSAPIAITVLSTMDSDCSAASNGSIQIDVTGGTVPYAITWSNGVTNVETISGLTPGNYSVNIEDANGCIYDNSTTPVTIGESGDITLASGTVVTKVNNTCYGDNSGALSVQVSGGSGLYEFRLQGDEIRNWVTPVPVTSDFYSFENLYAGTYEILVRDANNSACEYSLGSYTITQPNQLILTNNSTTGISNVTCNGSNDGWITVSAAGGSGQYDYSLDNGATWTYLSQISTYTFSDLYAGTYLIKVRDFSDASCTSATLVLDVDEPARVAASVINVSKTICYNSSDGTVTVAATGGSGNYDYYCEQTGTWQDEGVFYLPKGTYTFRAQDEDVPGCMSDATTSVEVSGPLDFSTVVSSVNNISCYGETDGEIYLTTTFSDGTSGLFEYSVDNGVSYQTSPVTGLAAGNYIILVRDANNNSCEKTLSTSVTITEPDELKNSLVAVTDVQCYGDSNGAIEISVSGGTSPYSYQWSGISDANGGKTDNPTNLVIGTYSVSITDSHGCAILPLPSYTVTQPDEIDVDYTVTHVTIGGQSTGSIVINNIVGGPTTDYDVIWDDGTNTMSRTNLAAGDYYFDVNVRDGYNAIMCTKRYNITVVDLSLPLEFTLTPTDAVCYGDNGSLEISINSGNPPYAISWSKGGTLVGTATTSNMNYIVSLPYGVYEVNIKDNVGGDVTHTGTVNQPDDFAVNAYVVTDKVCEGDLATVSLDITGGAWDNATAPRGDNFIVTWIDPDGLTIAYGTYTDKATQSDLSKAGTYTVRVFYNTSSDCEKSATVTVSDPEPLGISSTVVPVTCNGGSDGSISVIPTGRPSTHGFTYTWEQNSGLGWSVMTGETASSIVNKQAGTYRVSIQSISTVCNYTSGSIVITEPDEVQATVSHSDIITCYGDDSGVINLTSIQGGTEPYRYILNGTEVLLASGTSNYNMEGLTSQNYSLSIKDVNGCTSPAYSVNITQPEELTLVVTKEQIDCSVENSGVIELAVGGGRTISGTQKYLVTVSPDGEADIVLNTITNTTGAPVAVSDAQLTGLTENRYVIRVLDLNSDDAGKCVVNEEVNLEHINVTADVTDATCFGVNNGKIENVQITGASDNYTYSWSSADGGTGMDNSNPDQSGLSDGTYTLTITDTDRGSCIVTFDFVVGYKNSVNVSGSVSDVICNGEETGAISITPTGLGTGTTYNWTGPTDYNFTDNTTQNQSNLMEGTYTLTIETTLDGEQCFVSKDFTVSEPDAITYNAYFEYTDCDPYERTLVLENVKGGTGAYSYSWNGPAFIPPVPVDPTQILITQGGTYTITVSDKNLCAVTKQVIVPYEITIESSVTDLKCFNGNKGAIDITTIYGGSGSYSYAWTGPGSYTAATRNIDGLVAGDYQLTITDLNENVAGGYCSRTFDFTVNQPLEIDISPAVVDVSCYGASDGQIEIGVSGGTGNYSYNWTPVAGSNLATNKNQYNLPADEYTVIVTDANSCTATLTVPVNQDAELILSASFTDTQCDGTGGIIDLTVTGGSGDVAKYKYDWSSLNGSGLDTDAQDQTGLSGGDYTVVVTDTINGRYCSDQFIVSLTQAIEITNISISPVSCSGNDDGGISFDVEGGDGNYTYVWSAVAGYGGDALDLDVNDKDQSGLQEGRYQVVITDGRTDPSGTNCSITEVFDVPASTGLSVSVSESESNMCYGAATGKLVAYVTGGSGNYEYKWNGVVGTSTNDNLTQGVYQLEVTDLDLGCKFIQSYEINGPDAPISVDNIIVTPVLCYGESTGEIQVVVSGGTVDSGSDYTYQWSGPSIAYGSHPTGLVAGMYDLKIIDSEGCELDYADVEVTQPASHVIVSNPVIVNATTVGGTNGQISVSTSGGVAPYNYQWYNSSDVAIGIDDPVLSGIVADTYRVVVTDVNGCTFELTNLTVTDPGTNLGFTTTVHQVSPCNGSDNGEIYITNIFGGFPISGSYYRIQIVGPGVNVDENNTSWSLTNLEPGTYDITVTDGAAVQVQKSIEITEPDPLNIVTSKVSDVSCYDTSTGEISVTVSGGTPDASGNYLVVLQSTELGIVATKSDAKNGVAFSFSNLPAGNYTVIVYDHASDFDTHVVNGGNCSVSDFKLITQPEAQVELASVSGAAGICNGDSYDLTINTSDWDFADGNLRVSVYDNFSTSTYDVNETPYVVTVSPSSTRTYSITEVNKADGSICLQGDSEGNGVTVIVNSLPTANITGPSEVCEDGSVNLSVAFTGAKPFTFTWRDELNGTSGTETVDGYSYSITDSPAGDARYSILSVSDVNTCSAVGNGSVDVNINDKPTVSLSGGTDICIGESVNLNVGLLKGVSPYIITYTANGVEGTFVVNSDPVSSYTWSVTPQVTTSYQITGVVDGKGCDMDINSSLAATVIVNQLPDDIESIQSVADGGAICQGTSNMDYFVDAVANATSYVWTADAGMSIVTGNGTSNVLVNFDRAFAGGYIYVYAQNDCGASRVVERWVNTTPLPDAITVTPSGPTDICEAESGLVYSIPVSANASSYEWQIPAGLIVVGDATGTSVMVDVDPDVISTTGEIKVRPVNACSSDEPWSPGLTITITPLPEADAGDDERVCATTYTLQGNDPVANASGKWTILKGSGQFVDATSDPIVANGDIYNLSQGQNTFVWTVTNNLTGCYTSDTVSIYNDQVSVYASAENYTVCDGVADLHATPIENVEDADEAYWSTTGAAYITNTNDENTTAQGMDAGTNEFTWTIRKGSCYSTATIDIVNNEPTEAVVYNAAGVIIDDMDLPCGDDFTTLNGSTPLSDETGYWRVESGNVTIDNSNNPTINITNITPGDHVISWNIVRGSCSSKATVNIRNNYFTVDAGLDRTTCDGTINLSGSELTDGAVGEWTIIEGSGSFGNTSLPETTVTNLSQANDGRNVFRWTVRRNGCESYDEVVIMNYQPSTAELVGDKMDDSICSDEYTLSAVPAVYGTGLWTVVSGSGSFDDPTDPQATVSGVAIGDNVYRWTVYNETCSSSIDFTLTNLHVDVYAGPDIAVCGKTAALDATPAPSGATGEWSIASGAGSVVFNPSSSSPTASATSLGYGVNSLIWTVTKNGCSTSDTVNVYNNMPYEVNAASYIYTEGSSTTLRADIPTVGAGVWSLLEGRAIIANPGSATTEVTDLLPNYNYFRWTVTNMGCTDYVDVSVQSGVLSDAEAGSDQLNLCQNYTTMSANEPEGTYGEWTIVTGSADFTAYNDPEANITNIRSGRNVFMWTLRFAGGSSESKSDTVVIVNNTPSTAEAGYDITVCGDQTVMNARQPLIGTPTWAVLSGGGVFADVNDPYTTVTSLGTGENIFKYQIQNETCFSYDTISVFNYEPSEAYAGEDQVVCQDSALLNPSMPTYGEGAWRVVEGSGKGKDENGNETDEITGNYVYDLAPGTNKLVWEVKVPEAASTCVKRDTLIIINNEPSIAFAGHDRSICTDSVTLSGSVPVYGTGTWVLISGSGTIEDPALRNTKVSGLSLGANRFRWTIDNNGCTSYDDVEISNNLIEANAGYDQVNCADTAILEGNNPSPGTGTWGVVGGSGSANFENNDSPYTNVYNLDKGENVLTWTINYEGCQSVSQVVITNNQPSVADAGDNKATCETFITLGASTPQVGDGKWTIRSGGGVFTDDTNPTTRIDSMKFGSNIYRWTVKHEGCVSYDDVEINFNTIQATVGETQEICADNTYLEANNASPGIGTWSVVGGASSAKFINVNDPVTQVYDLAKGNNVLRWTINNQGCQTYAEVNIVNNMPGTAYAGNTQELCTSETTLDATAVSVGTGSWEVLTGSATIAASEINNPKANVTGLSKGENVLRWTVTSDNGLCTSEDEVVIINNEPSEPYAGASEEYCHPTVVLKAADPDYGTGLWSIIEGGGNFDDATLSNATISNLNPGVNVLRWTVTQGQCTLYSDITVTNSTPTTANAGPDILDCKNYAYLDANTPVYGTGTWTLISGNAEFTDVSDPKTLVSELTFGENILMWNIHNGSCISSDQISVYNSVPDLAQAGVDRSTCEDYITLNANDPDSGEGTWVVISGNGDFDDANNPTTIVRNLGLGENQFKWVVAYGECTTEDVVVITSNKAAPFAGEDDITYEPSYELKASNPGNLGAKWSVVAGTGSFEDDTFFNTTVSGLSEGVNTFRWLMDVNGCVTYDDVSIDYRVVPDAGFICDTTNGCYPLTVAFTNYSEGGSEFEWDFGDGETSASRNPVHTFEEPGTYTVVLTVPGPDGVNGEYHRDITVYDHPVADFNYSPDILYIPGDVLTCYSLSTDAVYYNWDFGDGQQSILVNPTHEYTDEGIYDISLSVENKYGCTDETVKEDAVTVIQQGFLSFPNSFMPRPEGGNVTSVGGGETNLVFRPVYRDVAEYKLQIFNRWGQLLYESTDIDEGWNGFYNGGLSPQAVYVWKAIGKYVSGKEFNMTGSVLLVR